MNALAKVLDSEAGVLTGGSPLPDPGKAPVSDPARVQIGAQIAPKARLAYGLIKRRYGVSATEIINMAPLFFVVLAEGSLVRRREKLKEAEGYLQQIEEESEHGGFGDTMVVADMAIAEEEDSITKADLFGEHLVNPTKDNPFAGYLCKLTKGLDISGVVNVEHDDLRYGPLARFPGYDICRDELDGIANKSLNARRALETGCARLSDIPEALMAEGAGEEREKWLEDKLLNIFREKEGNPENILVDTQAMSPQGDKMKEILEKAFQTNGENEKEGDSQ